MFVKGDIETKTTTTVCRLVWKGSEQGYKQTNFSFTKTGYGSSEKVSFFFFSVSFQLPITVSCDLIYQLGEFGFVIRKFSKKKKKRGWACLQDVMKESDEAWLCKV